MNDRGKATPQKGMLVGHVVNGHDVVRVLGAGGMGEVYLARHKVLGLERAIKVIHDDLKVTATATARFEREAIALSRLQHPGIVQVIDFGQLENGWPFLCMEYVDGPNLDQLVERTGPLDLASSLELLAQLAGVLAYAHGQGVVHRDLKPGNVILRKGDVAQAKIIDFGLARMISGAAMTKLTAEQQMVGSPMYMAPEQADGSPDITGAADVYALAGIAFMALSGRPVFAERSLLALIYAHANEDAEPLSARCRLSPIPPLLDHLIAASLAKAPGDRPAADELAAHFRNLARQLASAPKAPSIGLDATIAPTGSGVYVPPPPSSSRVRALALDPAPAPEASRALAGSVDASRMAPVAQPAARVESGAVRISDSMAMAAARHAVDAAAASAQVYEPARDTSPSQISAILFAPASRKAGQAAELREALVNQLFAVVLELATGLAPFHPDVADKLGVVEGLQAQVGDAELDLALIDSQLGETPRSAHAPLLQQSAETSARMMLLRGSLDVHQRELVTAVEQVRATAPRDVAGLYGEVDDLVQRALRVT